MANIKVAQIYTYPIKSLRGIALKETRLTNKGPAWDRRWMLIDQNGTFLSQRELGSMARLQPYLENSTLRIHDLRRGRTDLIVPLMPDVTGERLRVSIWGDECEAVAVSKEADHWFSEALGAKCRLVYMPDDSFRPVDPQYARSGESVSFADGYPYLLIGEASLEELNRRLEQPIEMIRFRPNLVFTGGVAFEEDQWSDLMINSARFRVTKRCARCQIPSIDLNTGRTSIEPTRTLAKFRRYERKIVFGVNACWEPEVSEKDNIVKVGDPVVIYSRQDHPKPSL